MPCQLKTENWRIGPTEQFLAQTREAAAPGGQAELEDVSVLLSGKCLPGHEAVMTSDS